MVPQVPLANASGRVTDVVENLRDGDFVRMQAFTGCGEEHTKVAFIDVHVDPPRIAAGHQAGTGRCTDRAGGIEIGESYALLRHLVQYGSRVPLGTEGTDVGITEIVTEHHNEVGGAAGFRRSGDTGCCQRHQRHDPQGGQLTHEDDGDPGQMLHVYDSTR